MDVKRAILVTGATGKQGRALTRALLPQYHIYALTRNISSSGASALQTEGGDNLTLVEGDLDVPSSIRMVFELAKNDMPGGIWGVFVVLQYPGLGANADGEEAQGKMMADLALEYQVQSFVYSSALRSGPANESQLKLSGKAKRNIEEYCKDLGEKGLSWTILRPGFFMENLDGFVGSIATSILRFGLKEDSVLGVIASEDIGQVAAGIFRNHEKYRHQVVVAVSEFATLSDYNQSHQRALGKPMPAIPSAAAWALLKMNKGSQDLITDMMATSEARKSGWPGLDQEIALANEIFKMRTYEEWLKSEQKPGAEGGWNGVSLTKLFTGRM